VVNGDRGREGAEGVGRWRRGRGLVIGSRGQRDGVSKGTRGRTNGMGNSGRT